MDASELITLAKIYYGQGSNVQGDGNFTDDEWLILLNRAYERIHDISIREGCTLGATTFNISWVADTKEYDISSYNIKAILQVEKGHESGADESEQLEIYPIDYRDRKERNIYGVQYYYLKDHNNTIGFENTPDETKTDNVEVLYIPKITELVTSPSATSPDLIPSEYHFLIGLLAAAYARIANDLEAGGVWSLLDQGVMEMRRSIGVGRQRPKYIRQIRDPIEDSYY